MTDEKPPRGVSKKIAYLDDVGFSSKNIASSRKDDVSVFDIKRGSTEFLKLEKKLLDKHIHQKPTWSKWCLLAERLISSQREFVDYQEGSLDHIAWQLHGGEVIKFVAKRFLYVGFFTGVMFMIIAEIVFRVLVSIGAL